MQPNHYSVRFRNRPHASKKEELKLDLSKILPFVAPFLIFFGVARIYFYYDIFNINILRYLDFTEIITSFFDVIIMSVFIIIVLLGTSAFLIANTSNEQNLKMRSFLILLCFFLAVILFFKFNFSGSFHYIGIILMALLFISYVLLWGIRKRKKPNTDKIAIKSAVITISFSLLIFTFWVSAIADAHDIKSFKKYHGVKINFIDNSFQLSDSITYYIGNTSNYIFIYNQDSNKTYVKKMNDVKSIEFPSNKDRTTIF